MYGPISSLPISGSGPGDLLVNFVVTMIASLLLSVAICAFVAAYRIAARNWKK